MSLDGFAKSASLMTLNVSRIFQSGVARRYRGQEHVDVILQTVANNIV
jgi:hypothetical protein